MKLIELKIEMEQWGENKGKYTGTIKFEDNGGVSLKIPVTDAISGAVLEAARGALLISADSAAEGFKRQIYAGFPKSITQDQTTP